MKNSAWRRAFAVLKKGNLAEERFAERRAFNTHDEENLRKTKTETTEELDSVDMDQAHREEDVVIILPEIVRNFSEGKDTAEKSEFFLTILSDWYEKLLHSIYIKNENIVYSPSALRTSSKLRKCNNSVVRDFESLGENISLFIERMLEKYQ